MATPLPSGSHQIRIRFDTRISLRDGVRLAAHVYQPAGAGPWPAVVVRTPYNKNNADTHEIGRWWAGRGYAYVIVDVRGRGDSEGDFTPYRRDGLDGYDTIEWVAAQPWCTGAVGTRGGSYLGHVQWLAALEQPPHLRAMVVLVTPSDPFVEWPTGTHGPMHLCWLHLTADRVNQYMEAVDWARVYEHLPLRTMDEQAGRHSAQWRTELDHTTRDEYWAPLCYQSRFERVTVPVLHISGWYDDEQIGTPLNYAGMRARGGSPQARAHQKLLMGPWGHAVNKTSKLGEVDFGPQAQIDLRAAEERWLARWLKDEDNGVEREPRVRLFVMGRNAWRDEDDWPLARAVPTHFYLHSAGNANGVFGDGRLDRTAPGDEPPDRFTYDPRRPVPFITEPLSSQIGGPDDYSALIRRGDLLWYVSEPLASELEVTGPLRLELYAASSARDTDFTALLCDVWPTGFAQRLADGIVRARFREGFDAERLIEPGRIYPYTIDLWHTSQVFQPGHRIGLMIASSSFPKFDRNLNTGESLADGVGLQTAEQTILHSAEHPSCLVLPLVLADGAAETPGAGA